MTCRHDDGDPTCSTKNPRKMRELAREMSARWDPPASPDASDFDVVRTEEHGDYFLVEAHFPSCAKCEFEGRKLMVFSHQNREKALRWRRLDPHFRPDPAEPDPRVAPPPIARFPATSAGWNMARSLVLALAAEARKR